MSVEQVDAFYHTQEETLKEHLTYKTGKQIWRILISGSEKVLIEKRDMESKEVYFDCLDLVSGEYVFTDLQFEEKFWLGIEKIYKDVIFFHKYHHSCIVLLVILIN